MMKIPLLEQDNIAIAHAAIDIHCYIPHPQITLLLKSYTLPFLYIIPSNSMEVMIFH